MAATESSLVCYGRRAEVRGESGEQLSRYAKRALPIPTRGETDVGIRRNPDNDSPSSVSARTQSTAATRGITPHHNKDGDGEPPRRADDRWDRRPRFAMQRHPAPLEHKNQTLRRVPKRFICHPIHCRTDLPIPSRSTELDG